jgi:hypothetical protein
MEYATQCGHADTHVPAYEITITLDSMLALLETLPVYNSELYAIYDPQ